MSDSAAVCSTVGVWPLGGRLRLPYMCRTFLAMWMRSASAVNLRNQRHRNAVVVGVDLGVQLGSDCIASSCTVCGCPQGQHGAKSVQNCACVAKLAA